MLKVFRHETRFKLYTYNDTTNNKYDGSVIFFKNPYLF